MRSLFRLLLVLGAAGVVLALGVLLLVPEAKAVATAGHSGRAQNVADFTDLSERSIVYARDGSLMASLHAEENRSPVTLANVPPQVYNAILDVEDDHFWIHHGVNLRSTVRALVTNVNAGGVLQGGSTITQQLVKNALLTPEKTASRKVKEAVLAVRLEDKLTKQEILERYLNTVYFGNGAYGIQAGAETYFNTDVAKLTQGQAAFLAGLIRNPVGYDPLRYKDAARSRRDVALGRQVANRHLTLEQAAAFKKEPIPTKVFTPLPPPNDYFVEEVKQRLLEDPRIGDTAQERYNAVFKGGLKITTTYDPHLHDVARDDVHDVLPDTKGKFTSALVSVEPGTGAVRAMFAGEDFNTTKYNLATARGGSGRQPGSSFKTIVLLAALDQGHSPNDTIDGTSPCTEKVPGFGPYTPENVEGEANGTQTLTDATVHSINCAYVKLGANVGLDKVVDMADRLGIPKKRLLAYPSISLGAQEVSPLEMAAAYAAIANDGVYHAPRFVEKVVDHSGKVLFSGPDKGTRVVSSQVAREATGVLQQVVQRGTGRAAAVRNRQVAGKTGTSENFENAWFVGYTPQLATAVWMGSPLGNVSMRYVGGRTVFGGTYPAEIWSEFMGDALANQPSVDFPAPDPRQVPAGRFIRDKYGSSGSGPSSGSSTSGRTYTPPRPPAPGPKPTTKPTTSTPPGGSSPPPSSPPASSPSPAPAPGPSTPPATKP